MKLIPLEAPRSREPQERAERARQVRAWIQRPELPERVEDWPEEAREHFEERAGIMEFHGGLTRDEAERQAETSVRSCWSRPPWVGDEDERLTDADAEVAGLSHSSRPR